MAAKLVSYQLRTTTGEAGEVMNEVFQAVKDNDPVVLQRCLEVDPEYISVSDDNGFTLLGVAAQEGHVSCAKTLIKHGAEVDHPDFYGQTGLQYAAEFGHVEMIKLLTSCGANVNWMGQNNDGLSAIHLATLGGKIEVVRSLIDAKCDVNAKDINGVTCLHCAVGNEHVEIVKLLLESHARVNVRGAKTGRTPLFVAAEIGNMEILNLLLKHAARVNCRDDFGMNALCAVCIQNNTEVALHLTEVGGNANMTDNSGSIPLHYASRFGNIQLMETLIKKGSKIDVMNKHFESPLHLAVKMEQVEAVRCLVKHGCDVNICDERGLVAPLHVAVNSVRDFRTFCDILHCLIERDVDLDSCAFASMETSLYRAVNQNKMDFAVLLLQHGANPNIDCPFDLTILQKACEKDELELIEVLLHCKIDWSRETWLDRDIHISGINPRLLTGYTRDVPRVLLGNRDLYAAILAVRCNPHSLMDQCRWNIRNQLNGSIYSKIHQTQLPPKLQDFVLMITL